MEISSSSKDFSFLKDDISEDKDVPKEEELNDYYDNFYN